MIKIPTASPTSITGLLTRRAFVSLLTAGGVAAVMLPVAALTPAWSRAPGAAAPDVTASDLTAQWALYEKLVGQLLETASATQTLSNWARSRGWNPQIVAHKLEADMRPAPAEIATLLNIPSGESIGYRKVELASDARVLSRADNWFVPKRLSSGVNAGLDTSETPFGKLISRLSPTRTVVSSDRLWTSPQQPIPPELFRLFAVVSGEVGDARAPLAVVRETYQAVAVAE